MMDRRNFLKATGITLAGLIAAGMVLPAVAKAVGTVKEVKRPKRRQRPHVPYAYKYAKPIVWAPDPYESKHALTAIIHGYDKDTLELKFCPVSIPEAELELYDQGDIEFLKRQVAGWGAQALEDDNCIVLTKY